VDEMNDRLEIASRLMAAFSCDMVGVNEALAGADYLISIERDTRSQSTPNSEMVSIGVVEEVLEEYLGDIYIRDNLIHCIIDDLKKKAGGLFAENEPPITRISTLEAENARLQEQYDQLLNLDKNIVGDKDEQIKRLELDNSELREDTTMGSEASRVFHALCKGVSQ